MFFSGILALNSFILFLCKLTIEFFFTKEFPHPSVDHNSWFRYKSTKYYWIFLKNMKDNSNEIDVFMDQIISNIQPYMNDIDPLILPSIQFLC